MLDPKHAFYKLTSKLTFKHDFGGKCQDLRLVHLHEQARRSR